MPKKHFLVLDAGTTNIKALVFDRKLNLIASASKPASKSRPKRGWVEQDPREYLAASRTVMRQVLRTAGLTARDILALGIANQRETTILWDKLTGRPVYPAIVWEDERTTEYCSRFEREKCEFVRSRTGLTVSPYFSATEIHWILNHVKACASLQAKKRLLFGTIDSWLMWNFIQGKPHLTDRTNAARTILFDIRAGQWDDELLGMFSIPRDLMPRVLPSRADFGVTRRDLLGSPVPIKAVCGDQQASLYAAGTSRHTTKATFGTGIFVSQILGSSFKLVDGFQTTLVPAPGQKNLYALEAKVGECARLVEPCLGKRRKLEVVLKHLAQKTAETIKSLPVRPHELVIDGGVTRDGLMGNFLSSITQLPVRQQRVWNGTALGIAMLLQDRQKTKTIVK
ncbi:MAG: FGGY family carbohydrate kinase [Patescibacteria group bacterium]